MAIPLPRLLLASWVAVTGCSGDPVPLRHALLDYAARNPSFQLSFAGVRDQNPCLPEPDTTLIPVIRCRTSTDPAGLSRLAWLLASAPGGLENDAEQQWAEALVDLVSLVEDPVVARRVVDRLQELTHQPGIPGHLWNDLAIAQLHLAEREQNHTLVFQALNSLEQAYLADSASSQIAANRAWLLDRLGLRGQAGLTRARHRQLSTASESTLITSGAEFLDANPLAGLQLADSLHKLDSSGVRRLAAKHPDGSRELLLRTLLPDWARLARGGAPQAPHSALQLRWISEGYRARSGGSALARLVDWTTSRVADTLLLDGLVALGEGVSSYQRGAYGVALDRLGAARVLLDGTPLNGWMTFFIGAVHAGREQYPEAIEAFTTASRIAEDTTDPALAGRSAWGIALSLSRQGRYQEGLTQYLHAIEAFSQVGEEDHAARLEFQTAALYGLMGLDESSLRLILRAARRGPETHATLASIAHRLLEIGLPWAAAVFAAEDVALPGLQPDERAEGLVRLVRSLHRTDDPGGAARALQEAIGAVDSIPPGERRERVRAEVAMAGATVLPDRPREAVHQLDQALAFFGPRNVVTTLQLQVPRTRLLLTLGDTLRALEALTDAAERLVRSTSVRRIPPETAAQVFLQLAAIRLARGDTVGAFWLEARSRGVTAGDSLRFETLRHRIPSHTGLMTHTQERDRLLIWMWWRGKLSVRAVQMEERSMGSWGGRLQSLAAGRAHRSVHEPVARAIYDSLLGPELAATPELTRVLVAAAPTTYAIPLAAALDSSGQPAVTRVALGYATDVVTGAMAELSPPATGAGTVLAVNPDFDRRVVPDLAPLPRAREEVAQITGARQRSEQLTGPGATISALRVASRNAGTIHFAGHARVSSLGGGGGGGVLVLAPSANGDAGLLPAEEVRRWDLGHVSLVVLSACGGLLASGDGGQMRNPLAGAFIEAGARQVVSSLWEVDDATTGSLMGRLHHHLGSGHDPMEALRRAQMDQFTESRDDLSWSRFRVDR